MIPLLRLFSKVNIICHTHNVEAERFRSIGKPWWLILKRYEGWVLRNCDHIFCITDADRDYMIKKMKVSKSRCVIVPYGINEKSSPLDKSSSKSEICKKHNLNPNFPLLFFNGLLDYKPNLEALNVILEKIQPILKSKGYACNILIAGKSLPASYKELKNYHHDNIYYAGFVDDINAYTKAADILLNPVITGGGIKTKMIEALGLGTTVVSTVSGAVGVDKDAAGNKIIIVKDADWVSFAEKLITATNSTYIQTPITFYEIFYWGNIVNRILNL
jgi:glycosyltransferase involved in cell wall biosynthesis